MATIRDVARAAGVSPATASRALATPHRVSPERRGRVERAALALGYRPPSEPSGPPSARPSRTVGVVVPDLGNPYFAALVQAVQRRARSAGAAVVVADCEEDPRLEQEVLAGMTPTVAGVVLCSARMSDRALGALPAQSRVVLVNREAEQRASVAVDNDDGMRQALTHLHALGHRRVAYAGGQWGSWSDRARRRGLETAARDLAGVELVPLGHFATTFGGGVAAADVLAASGATAVVAHNDLMAVGVLDRLRQRGIDVPGRVSVVGFDDVPAATQVSPRLTTVAAPLAQLGAVAIDLLLDPPEEDERVVTVPVALQVRDSTAAPTT
ncbi:LacI family transcriptional regulator [Actinotalea ferrariae CF5-4]|uniref:LacI family transcriptional regulator n=1 Tax=Actinotalea ferrariae CF5-4 TaxID=948458 RepID=A0A021VYA5_9CELL|nr:LacI family DNA-binding transcriptional regulator [Actinotalea ferrariae]EYR64047.1 LacI family transcriptional regulator [Actinotalea ferrariae CF5-4]